MRNGAITKIVLLPAVLLLLITGPGCSHRVNPVADYLKNAELQYEGKAQEETIAAALNDILSLPDEQLKAKKYSDYAGTKDQWDLPTLISRHFVPDRKGKSLGDSFYCDVCSEEARREIRKILERMKSSR